MHQLHPDLDHDRCNRCNSVDVSNSLGLKQTLRRWGTKRVYNLLNFPPLSKAAYARPCEKLQKNMRHQRNVYYKLPTITAHKTQSGTSLLYENLTLDGNPNRWRVT